MEVCPYFGSRHADILDTKHMYDESVHVNLNPQVGISWDEGFFHLDDYDEG